MMEGNIFKTGYPIQKVAEGKTDYDGMSDSDIDEKLHAQGYEGNINEIHDDPDGHSYYDVTKGFLNKLLNRMSRKGKVSVHPEPSNKKNGEPTK